MPCAPRSPEQFGRPSRTTAGAAAAEQPAAALEDAQGLLMPWDGGQAGRTLV